MSTYALPSQVLASTQSTLSRTLFYLQDKTHEYDLEFSNAS